MFRVGETYSRRRDIHDRFKGQQQGGISTPQKAPFIFLFTGDSGEAYGYQDGWKGGVFRYTGEGQVGDMEFRVGNLAVRDHASNGKDLLLFQTLGKAKPVRFVGRFACEDWEIVKAPDREGSQRNAIVFLLRAVDEDAITSQESVTIEPQQLTRNLVERLRRRAYDAARPRALQSTSARPSTVYERAEAVRVYVLARSKGECECCRSPAPFTRSDGTAYLEPHHTRRVSDGGPDHPKWVGAICPNCHREIHFGIHGPHKNQSLERYICEIEEELDRAAGGSKATQQQSD